jgi:2,3-bisphosphoglycerate-independent phosphoglycerate mutase
MKNTKYIIVIIDGAADNPVADLDNSTPLEAAHIPTLDWMAARGIMGSVHMVPEGMSPGSDVAIMSLLGYDPEKYYSGRAPIEAEAQKLQLNPDDWVFRCNLVTINNNIMKDHSAGNITSRKAEALIKLLNKDCPLPGVRFYPGVSYRNLMSLDHDITVQTVPPHDILEKDISDFLPGGQGGKDLRALIEWSATILARENNHDATHIWLWGQGKKPLLPSFFRRFSKKGAVITAVDLVRGLARLIGWDIIEVPGATGNFYTDYHGKGLAAIKAIEEYDVVCVHVEAPDEAGHKGDAHEKMQALEKIDKSIIKPILDTLHHSAAQWSLLVLPDHPTPCVIRTHTADPVPFVLLDHTRTEPVAPPVFSEKAAADRHLLINEGHTLIQKILQGWFSNR